MQSQSDRDARIRNRAYQIWLGEGRPHGHDEAHWQQAEREIQAQEAGAAGGKKAPARSTRAKQAPVTSEADPSTVSRVRTKDDAAANKPRVRDDAPATGTSAKSTSRRRNSAKA